MRCIQRIPNSSAKGNTKGLLSSRLCPPPCHIFVCCCMSSSLVHVLCLSPWYLTTFSSSPIKHSISCCPSCILLQERALYPRYLWVLWCDLPFVVPPGASPCLGHCLLKFINKTKLTPKTLANESLSTSQASPFLIQDTTTEIKYPQKPLICACMLTVDYYCPPWFCMLALLQSECVACHESRKERTTKFWPYWHMRFFLPRRELSTIWKVLTSSSCAVLLTKKICFGVFSKEPKHRQHCAHKCLYHSWQDGWLFLQLWKLECSLSSFSLFFFCFSLFSFLFSFFFLFFFAFFFLFFFFCFFNIWNIGESLTGSSGALSNGPKTVHSLRVVTSGLWHSTWDWSRIPRECEIFWFYKAQGSIFDLMGISCSLASALWDYGVMAGHCLF